MKKMLWGFAASALILTSCANNELLGGEEGANGEIRFTAYSHIATKSQPYQTNEHLAYKGSRFGVVGFLKGEKFDNPYLGTTSAGAIMNFNGAAWEYINIEDSKFWPDATLSDDNKLTFLAYAPASVTPTTISKSAGLVFENFTVADATADQKDLIYAKADEQTRPANRQLLTFKHALTQIRFGARVASTDMKVQIASIEVVNIKDKATLTVPYTTGAEAVWTAPTDDVEYKAYALGMHNNVPVTIEYNAMAPTNLTNVGTVGESNDGALLMIPQTFGAWNPSTTPNISGATASDQGYVKLSAKIWDESQGPENPVYLYGNEDDYMDIYIPLSSLAGDVAEWTPNKKITYNIIFGDANGGSGGGGYTGGDTNGDGTSDPVLYPIKFETVVSGWYDIDVNLQPITYNATTTEFLTPAFIEQNVQNLASLVKSDPLYKIYGSTIAVNGPTNSALTINVSSLADLSKMVLGSTVTFDFTKITGLDATNTLGFVVPNGFTASNDGGTTAVVAGSIISIDAPGTIVLTKLPAGVFNETSGSLQYVNNWISANVAEIKAFTATQSVALSYKNSAETITTSRVLNVAALSQTAVAGNISAGSTVTFDFTSLSGLSASTTISLIVPSGWTVAGAAAGQVVTLTSAGTLTLTKE